MCPHAQPAKLSQDRSLGYVELKVSELAQAAEGESAYVSTGKRVGEDPIRLDKGSFKGKLFYEAEFVPAMHVKNVKFASGPNAIEKAVEDTEDADGGDVSEGDSSSDFDTHDIPITITASAPLSSDEQVVKSPKGHKKNKSTDTTGTTRTTESHHTASTTLTGKSGKANGTSNEKRPEDDAPELSKEELLKHRT